MADSSASDGPRRSSTPIPATYVNYIYQRADAFLFGRRTYEIFAGSWGAMDDPSINPIAVALDGQPKYVASTTLTDPFFERVVANRIGAGSGAGDESRTRDLNVGNVALYQLSYSRVATPNYSHWRPADSAKWRAAANSV